MNVALQPGAAALDFTWRLEGVTDGTADFLGSDLLQRIGVCWPCVVLRGSHGGRRFENEPLLSGIPQGLVLAPVLLAASNSLTVLHEHSLVSGPSDYSPCSPSNYFTHNKEVNSL